MKQYHQIVAEIRKQMYLRGWKTKDLAEATGYTVGTIRVMLTNPKKMSEKSLIRICQALNIVIEEKSSDI